MSKEMKHYYLVWWAGEGLTPEDQLMGIHYTLADAKLLKSSIETHSYPSKDVYITKESVDEKGACY